jgi:NADPH:quinone reductase-like Zn-dependent oxidoreductase
MKVAEMIAPGIQGIRTTTRPLGLVGRGEALVRVHAMSLNYRDVLIAEGLMPLQYPRVPLSDASGEVVEVGEGVTRVRPGDRVCPIYYQDWMSGPIAPSKLLRDRGGTCDGVATEMLIIAQEELVKIPAHLSYVEASTLPCAALAAWSAVMDSGKAKPGQRVLVQGTGGVSLFSLQFARMAGADVIMVSSSEAKLDRARALGASSGINYIETPDWATAVLDLTAGRGVDLIVDVIGPSTIEKSMAAVASGGVISQVGVLSGFTINVPVLPLMSKSVRIQGVINGNREAFEEMMSAVAMHEMRPVLDRTFALERLPNALEHMKSRSHIGKLTISME